MHRIVVIDDHAMFRQGVRSYLKAVADFEVVGEAGRTAEGIQLVRRLQPDLVLLDLFLPGRGGLAALGEIKDYDPDIRVLIVTSAPEERYGVRALRSGADGYIGKDQAVEVLESACRRILAGGKYLSPDLAQHLAFAISPRSALVRHESLSNREMEVLRRIASGSTVSEIAEDLHLSVKTVSTYRTRIREKTGLRNNAEMMRYALEEGLVE